MTTLFQLLNETAQPEVVINQNFQSVGMAGAFGQKTQAIVGLSWAYYGAQMIIHGVPVFVADGNVTMLDGLNYVQVHPNTGVVSRAATNFTEGFIPIALVNTSSALGRIIAYTDYRQFIRPANARTLVLAAADANFSLTRNEADNDTLIFSGTLTATRTVTLPLIGYSSYRVVNKTTQSLLLKAATGTGVTIVSARSAIITFDGVNYVRVTADSVLT